LSYLDEIGGKLSLGKRKERSYQNLRANLRSMLPQEVIRKEGTCVCRKCPKRRSFVFKSKI